MTFTTAAASEMRDRVGAVAGKKMAKELVISTFHSFSLQLCRLHAEKYAQFLIDQNLLFTLPRYVIRIWGYFKPYHKWSTFDSSIPFLCLFQLRHNQ